MPRYSPMQPTLVKQPFHRPGWVYEEKVDGWRMLAYKDCQAERSYSLARLAILDRHEALD